MTDLTKAQAIRMASSSWWTDMPARDVAMFQLHERLLCMPYGVFRNALNEALGRGVHSHELRNPDALIRELLGEERAPTLAEIIQFIPADKRVVIWPSGKIDGVPQ